MIKGEIEVFHDDKFGNFLNLDFYIFIVFSDNIDE